MPAERIAHYPLPQRDASQLLVYRQGTIEDSEFSSLPRHLPEGTVLVLNDTMVIEARIFFQKASGGLIEIFCLEPHRPADVQSSLASEGYCEWSCLIGGASKWKPGLVLEKIIKVNDREVKLEARYLEKKQDHFVIAFSWEGGFHFAEILHQAGTIPLPPYIKRKSVETDKERYQTIFNREPGSVAAPTASLHFTDAVLAALSHKKINPVYITLNVGAGTFMPVKTENLAEHQMHPELFSVSKAALERLMHAECIVAGGTTTLRTLESLYWIALKTRKDRSARNLQQWEAYSLDDTAFTYRDAIRQLLDILEASGEHSLQCSTQLLIMPGYRFKSAEGLITNFHQPKSTLLALVAAFVGDDWKKIYAHALEHDYRFLSYGDSSLLWRQAPA